MEARFGGKCIGTSAPGFTAPNLLAIALDEYSAPAASGADMNMFGSDFSGADVGVRFGYSF
jgi:hypothetical protein